MKPTYLTAVTTATLAATGLLAMGQIKWEPLYEPGCGGAITAVAVSPHDGKHLVSLGDMLGVATSFDGGDSWQSTFGFRSYEFGGGVTFHPTDAKTIWIGSAMGPYKSTDGGINWVEKRDGMPEVSGGKYTAMIEVVLYDPDQPGRLLTFGGTSRRWNKADTFGWVWESTMDGEAWQHVGTIAAGGFTTDKTKGANVVWASYEPGSTSVVHVLADDAGWYVSRDDGRTFAKQDYTGLPTAPSHLTFHPKDAKTIWASARADGETGGVFKSTDGGRTFTPSDVGIDKKVTEGNGNLTSHFSNVVVSAAAPDTLFVNDKAWNTATIYKSTDAGATWKPVAARGGIGVKHEGAEAVFSPRTATHAGISLNGVADPNDANQVYWYNTEFILRTRDGGKTWDDATAYNPDPAKPDHWRGRGWNGWCSTNFEWNPYRPNFAVAQAMDAGRAWISEDGLKSWRYLDSDKTHPWLAGEDVTFSKDGHVYISTGQFGANNGIHRSTDSGKTWQLLSGAAHGLPEHGWNAKPVYNGIHSHPTHGKRVWVALNGKILHSSDGGEKWAPVDGAPEGSVNLASDPTDADRFYVTAKDGVFVTTDGKAFESVGGPQPGGRGRINCDAKGRVLVCQWREGRSGVWRYDPAAKQWARLLDEPLAYEVNADPSDATRLLMVTAQDPYNDLAGGNGVWVSSDDGKSWARANDGLAMLRGLATAFNPHDPEQIVVGTYGRGFFTTRWPKSYKPAGERTYAANQEDALYAALDRWPEGHRAYKIRNGTMTDGGDVPTDWTGRWVGRGDIKVSRDTKTFASGPASLLIETVGDAAGNAHQQFDGEAGDTFRVSGTVRSSGKVQVNLAVQTFADDGGNWRPLGFEQVGYQQNDTDWTRHAKDVTLPEGTKHFFVLLLVEGEGRAWLDDVKLTPAANAKPVVRATAGGKAAGAGGDVTAVIRDFGGVDYTYGQSWKNGENVTTGKDGSVTFLQIDTTEHGGGGIVLNGQNVVPQDQTHLAVRARLMAGNEAATLNVNLVGSDNSVTLDLTKLKADEWSVLTVELPGGPGKYKSIQQLQLQGGNWSDGAKKLRVQIDSIGTTTLDAKANEAAKELAKRDPTTVPPAKDKPWVPAWGFWPDHPQAWQAMLRGQVEQTKKGNIEVVFLGDSLTQGWHGDVWKTNWEPTKAVNYGIGGDSTRQVLYRLEHGLVDGIKPKLVVLCIGTNNLYDDFNAGSDEEIARGIEQVVKTLRTKLPDTKILLMGLLPRQNDWFCGRIDRINAVIKNLDDGGKTVRYLDLTSDFEVSHGKVKRELYTDDQLHISKKGYELWAEKLRPVVKQMME